MMYRYFVSYSAANRYGQGMGFGSTAITLTQPIRGGEDVQAAVRAIEAHGVATRVTVLYWRRFEESEDGQ